MKKLLSLLITLVMIITVLAGSGGVVLAGAPPETILIVGGTYLTGAEPGTVEGVTYTPATETDPAKLTLSGANISTGYTNGTESVGIYIQGFDNFEIIISGTNTINLPVSETDPSTVGIEMSSGNLIMSGTGTIGITADHGIFMDGRTLARTLDFRGSLTANISSLRLEPVPNPPSAHTNARFLDSVNVTLGARLTDGTYEVAALATLNMPEDPGGPGDPGGGYDPSMPSTFRFGAVECVANPVDWVTYYSALTEPLTEETVASGTGWQVDVLPFADEMTGDVLVSFNLTLTDYSGGPVYIENWDGFLWINGDVNIAMNMDSISLEVHDSRFQAWGEGSGEESVSFEGGILLDNSEMGSMVFGQWQIGTAETLSPKGLTGMGNSRVILNGDTFTIYTGGDAISDINSVYLRDESRLVAYANGEGVFQVGDLYALTGSSYDIRYGLGGEPTDPIPGLMMNHVVMYLMPRPDQIDQLFPEPIKYYGDANMNTLLYSEDATGTPDFAVEGDELPLAQRKYILTDEALETGRHYYFESTASKMTRVHADDAGDMAGGTILIKAANGYNDGGYVVEAGSTVRVEILPDAGYQYKSGTLVAGNNSPIVLTPTSDPAVYTFTMPDTSMAVGCEFEAAGDRIVTDSAAVLLAAASIPAGTIQNGNALFRVADKEMTDEQLNTALSGAGDIEVGAVLDLKLDQMITKDGSLTDPWLQSLTQLNSAMTIQLTVEEALRGMADYRVFRIHDGVTEEINASYSNGVISFQTDRFSTYILGYGEAAASVKYRSHIQDIGWQDYVSDGALSGTSGLSKRMEAVQIKLALDGVSGGIEYRSHIQDIGWQGWVSDDAVSGTNGESKRLEAIEVRLTGEIATLYDVYYRVHVQNMGWLDWAQNGQPAGTAGYSYRLEAIEVKLVLKGEAAPGTTGKPFIDKNAPPPSIIYRTHVQDIGWQAYSGNGNAAGTTGQSKRLEAIQINLEGITGIQYRTHVQDNGWMDWVTNDQISGTSGQSKRLEAIQIRLTGVAAEAYDIYYCVHSENTGWMDWAKNGQSAGTAGLSRRLEAIKIVIVPKGGPAPGATTAPFIQGR